MSPEALQFEHWKAMHLWNEILGWPWPTPEQRSQSPVHELASAYWTRAVASVPHAIAARYGA